MSDASNGHNCVEADYKKGGEMAMGGLGGGGQKPIFKDNCSVSTIDDNKNVCCLYLRWLIL